MEKKSPQQIKNAILKLYGDLNLRKSMSQNNFKLSEIFSPQNVAKEYENIYRRIINQ